MPFLKQSEGLEGLPAGGVVAVVAGTVGAEQAEASAGPPAAAVTHIHKAHTSENRMLQKRDTKLVPLYNPIPLVQQQGSGVCTASQRDGAVVRFDYVRSRAVNWCVCDAVYEQMGVEVCE